MVLPLIGTLVKLVLRIMTVVLLMLIVILVFIHPLSIVFLLYKTQAKIRMFINIILGLPLILVCPQMIVPNFNFTIMHIIQKSELYSGKQLFNNAVCSSDNPTLQNLDTSLISLLKGVDECGKVNNFTYSEDNEVKCIDDEMERTDTTHHEMSYYDGLAENVVENAAQVAENQSVNTPTVENTTVDTPSAE